MTVAPDLRPTRGAVYVERGYDAAALHSAVAARGLRDGIMRRGRKNRPLSAAPVERNHELSLIRRAVEPGFGTLKRSYAFHRMPYFNAARNTVAFGLAASPST